ncbi:thioredoxin-related transmembrane protein 1 [Orussus abietinus]|uniref:thioredoxin-related transmembrane protein 1 n=1 Tax=Orussus abietinus TaxID=222816 RepID=UPI0006258D27|nr:thioredoxin-related transmembrane protein 1 [Orussus abietinus]
MSRFGRVLSTFFVTCITLFALISCQKSESSKNAWVDVLDENNWDRMLTGEWMVEFYAPWCPACKALEPVWNSLASWKKDLNINVGKVDVTDSPGLSGRFMVTALPTIYHVKDGVFRQYKSPRDKDSLIEFVTERTWEKVEPIPSWKSPTSIQMSIISLFFRMSPVLRGIQTKLLEDFGLPAWGSYLILAIVTIIVGAILGLFVVCLLDLVYPKKCAFQGKGKQKDSSGGFVQEKGSQDDELVENVKDDLVDEEGSESEAQEENKDKDTNLDSNELVDETAAPSSPNVRKRKPRKAD